MEIGFQPKLEQYKFQCVDFSLGCSHKRWISNAVMSPEENTMQFKIYK